MEHNHLWKEVYKTDYRARSATGTTTRVEWCEQCGCVQVHNSYHELMEHHTNIYHTKGVNND